MARVCRAKAQGAKGSSDSKRSNYLEAQTNSNPITLDLALKNVPVKVELDTGAAVSVQAVPALQSNSRPILVNRFSLGVHHYKLGMVPRW